MQTFCDVFIAGGITHAAKKDNVSPALVSKRLAFLEKELGVTLFLRTTRQVKPTEEGVEYFECCRKILLNVDDSERKIKRKDNEPSGMLKIVAPLSFGVTFIGEFTAQFLARYPLLSIHIELSDQYVDFLELGFDLALRITTEDLPDSTLVAKKLMTIDRVTCAAPDYLKYSEKIQKPEDLLNHRCLVYGNHKIYDDWVYTRNDKEFLVKVLPVLKSNNGELLRQSAISSAGVMRGPKFIVQQALRDGQLQAILSDYEIRNKHLFAFYPQQQFPSPKLVFFIKEFSHYLQNLN